MKFAGYAVSLSILSLFSVAQAQASTLWKGIAVITANSTTTACDREYDVGEDYAILYRPNLGAAVNETMMVMGTQGAYLISSLPADADKTLRTGGVSISGASYASPFSTTVASNPLTISPSSVTATTARIDVTGTVKNLGLAGCNVSFKATLLPIFDGAN